MWKPVALSCDLHLACRSLSEGWFLFESLTVAHFMWSSVSFMWTWHNGVYSLCLKQTCNVHCIVSFHAAFDFSCIYGQFASLVIYAIQVFLLYFNLYHTTFLNHLDLVVGKDTPSDMFCIASVLYQNFST